MPVAAERTAAERKAAADAAKAEPRRLPQDQATAADKAGRRQVDAAATKKPTERKAAAKKTAAKESAKKGTGLVAAAVGDVTVAALAAAAALALLAPGVKSKAPKATPRVPSRTPRVPSRASTAYPARLRTSAASCSSTLSRTFPCSGRSSPAPPSSPAPARRFSSRRRYRHEGVHPRGGPRGVRREPPGELPKPGDIGTILSPASNLAKNAMDADLDILQDDVQQAPARLQRWFQGLENPVETIAPPAAALGATVVAGQVANLPVLARARAAPSRARRRGVRSRRGEQVRGEEGGSPRRTRRRGEAGGDAVKALAGKK